MLLRVMITLVTVYFFGAIYYDGPMDAGSFVNVILALLWLSALVFLYKSELPRKKKYGLIGLSYGIAIIPWVLIPASNERDWTVECLETGRVDVRGDTLTFHQCRNFIHSENGTVAQWETREHHLSKLEGVDLFFAAFGGDSLAHTILSFDFGDEGRLCLSIETRREKGEKFSAIGGLYKMYDLQYVFGSEEDLIALRTNIRKEPVFLYRLKANKELSRRLLMESVEAANDLYETPRFYNVIWANCTTSYRAQTPENKRWPYDLRMLVNGYLDSYLYEKNALVTDGLAFEKYNQQAKVNAAADRVTDREEFSAKIREDRVGF